MTPPDATPTSASSPPHITVASLREALDRAGLLVEVRGTLPETVVGIADDSRAVRAGSLFVAVRGSQRDGHDYLGVAEQAGAALVIVEDAERTTLPALVVRDGRRAAAIAAAAAYGQPARQLTLVGVTGTNGKTTTVGMLRHLFDAPSAPRRVDRHARRAASAPTARRCRAAPGSRRPGRWSCSACSGSSSTRRERSWRWRSRRTRSTSGAWRALTFDAAVFTNLTRDHLDYHGTMDAYLRGQGAAARSISAPTGVAVVNADDPAWARLATATRTVTVQHAGRDQPTCSSPS